MGRGEAQPGRCGGLSRCVPYHGRARRQLMSPAGCACSPGGIRSEPEPIYEPWGAPGPGVSGPTALQVGRSSGVCKDVSVARPVGFCAKTVCGREACGVCLQPHTSRGSTTHPQSSETRTWSSPHLLEQTLHHMGKHHLEWERHLRPTQPHLPWLMRSLLTETPASTALVHAEGVSATCLYTWVMCDGELWLSPEISPSTTVAGGSGCSEELPSPEEFLTKVWQLR